MAQKKNAERQIAVFYTINEETGRINKVKIKAPKVKLSKTEKAFYKELNRKITRKDLPRPR
jgi:hypothetical protein